MHPALRATITTVVWLFGFVLLLGALALVTATFGVVEELEWSETLVAVLEYVGGAVILAGLVALSVYVWVFLHHLIWSNHDR